MLLKAIATGRQFGDKRDPVSSTVRIAGVECTVEEFDGWEGPIEPGGSAQYFRFTMLRTAKPQRDDRFAAP